MDNIPPKIVKAAAPVTSRHIKNIVNEMQANFGVLPNSVEKSPVYPYLQKDDPFVDKNHRPVSILPTISKVYERLLSEPLSDLFSSILTILSAFGCQTTLLRLIEDWKRALDNYMCVGAIKIDQLAKPIFRSRYAHTPFGSPPLPILLS